MKLNEPHHKEILHKLLDAFADKESGLMPDQHTPCYAGLSRCWGWHGSTFRGGYAAIQIKNWYYAGHRVSYFLRHGDIPDKMVIRHRCDNKVCTNPDHLEIGTHAENMQDLVERRHYMPGIPSKPSLNKVRREIHSMLNTHFIHEVAFVGRNKDEDAKSLSKVWDFLARQMRRSAFRIAHAANPDLGLHKVNFDDPFDDFCDE